jgi:hypothetical protein
MKVSFRARQLALSLSTLMLFGSLGCNSSKVQASGSGSGADVSGPPTFNEQFQARNPRTCAKVTGVPSAAEATALVQCDHDKLLNSYTLLLVSDLTVEMGSPRVATTMDSDINDLDSTAKIYPLRGQGTNWSCGLVSQWGAGTNCQKWPAVTGGTGRCWHTLFNEWKCGMTSGGPNWVAKQKGPTTY